MAITLDGTNGITFPDGDVQTGVVGNVSQNSGIPTGAVIESGSNANGTFIKFPDGTMICNLQALESRSATGVLATAVTFPATFADVLIPSWNNTSVSVIATMISTVPATATTITVSNITTTGCTVYINRSTTTSTAFSLICYGRWY